MGHHRLIAGALLAGAALVSGALGPAAAATNPAPVPTSHSTMDLTVSDPTGVQARTVRLRCDPAGGTHPAAPRACHDLDQARGDFNALPGDRAHTLCPMVYRPVVASARGTWRGRPVSFRNTYPNACMLQSRTGPVFGF